MKKNLEKSQRQTAAVWYHLLSVKFQVNDLLYYYCTGKTILIGGGVLLVSLHS